MLNVDMSQQQKIPRGGSTNPHIRLGSMNNQQSNKRCRICLHPPSPAPNHLFRFQDRLFGVSSMILAAASRKSLERLPT